MHLSEPNRLLTRLIALLTITGSLVACASTSSSTVELSTQITERTRALERTHVATINNYFDQQEARVEDFLVNDWVPLFYRNFLGTSGVMDDLARANSIAISNDTRYELAEAAKAYLTDPDEADDFADRLVQALNESRTKETTQVARVVDDFMPRDVQDAATSHMMRLLGSETPAGIMIEWSEAARLQIEAQRKSLIAPLQRARMQVLAAVHAEYADIYAAQAAITGQLQASATASEQQQMLVDNVIGPGTSETFRTSFAQLSRRIDAAIADGQRALETASQTEEAVTDVRVGIEEALSDLGVQLD